MKRFKFKLDGSFVFYFGYTMGRAIKSFIEHRPERVEEITAIVEEPIMNYER